MLKMCEYFLKMKLLNVFEMKLKGVTGKRLTVIFPQPELVCVLHEKTTCCFLHMCGIRIWVESPESISVKENIQSWQNRNEDVFMVW